LKKRGGHGVPRSLSGRGKNSRMGENLSGNAASGLASKIIRQQERLITKRYGKKKRGLKRRGKTRSKRRSGKGKTVRTAVKRKSQKNLKKKKLGRETLREGTIRQKRGRNSRGKALNVERGKTGTKCTNPRGGVIGKREMSDATTDGSDK